MNYVDIDYHRLYSHMTLMDREGQTIRAGRVPNVRVEIEKPLEVLEAVEAVIETGRPSDAMVDVLAEMGAAVEADFLRFRRPGRLCGHTLPRRTVRALSIRGFFPGILPPIIFLRNNLMREIVR